MRIQLLPVVVLAMGFTAFPRPKASTLAVPETWLSASRGPLTRRLASAGSVVCPVLCEAGTTPHMPGANRNVAPSLGRLAIVNPPLFKVVPVPRLG